jgi:hypothetical protein
MEDKDTKLYDCLSSSTNLKEEIFQLDEFINRYESDEKYDGPIFKNIFNILLEIKLTSSFNQKYFIH